MTMLEFLIDYILEVEFNSYEEYVLMEGEDYASDHIYCIAYKLHKKIFSQQFQKSND